MRRSKYTREEIHSKLVAILGRVQNGETLGDALKAEELPRTTYFRWKRSDGANVLPALRKDWQELARVWHCPSLRDLPPTTQEAIRKAVAEALSRIYGKPSVPRLATEISQLTLILRALDSLANKLGDLDHPARSTLEELVEPAQSGGASIAHLLDRLVVLISGLREHVDALSEHAKQLGETRGGRNVDPRVNRLTVALATIFAEHLHSVPTHTTDPATGNSISHFDDFVEGVFTHFLPELRIAPTAIREATRHTTARLDWGGDIPG